METYSHHEDQEALMFHAYPCAYYVQSPSTISHANSADHIRNPTNEDQSAVTLHFHSPTPSESAILTKNPDVSRFTLSRYSSSRGSNNSFLHDKSIVAAADHKGGFNRLIMIDHGVGKGDQNDDDDDNDDEEGQGFYGKKKGWWWRYCSFRSSNSCAWISLQICWRLVLSLGFALLVFYIATKPPPPKISVKRLLHKLEQSIVYNAPISTPMLGCWLVAAGHDELQHCYQLNICFKRKDQKETRIKRVILQENLHFIAI
ncbi:hypothetical protein V6Z11_D08G175800 [Gossypium hirsutum]|uniref:Uncharacterized protein n=1 Tax=Gossypium darwinii TaxID=34276 RepID=A0A5D2BQR8_GOSDA|nr:hypothetical protein ES288_D08G190700v1 [Gossypium darwinii]